MSDNERTLIGNVLALFAVSDKVVKEILADKFLTAVQMPKARACYSFRIFMESIRSETYFLLIATYFRDEEQRDRLLRAIVFMPSVKPEAHWVTQFV